MHCERESNVCVCAGASADRHLLFVAAGGDWLFYFNLFKLKVKNLSLICNLINQVSQCDLNLVCRLDVVRFGVALLTRRFPSFSSQIYYKFHIDIEYLLVCVCIF